MKNKQNFSKLTDIMLTNKLISNINFSIKYQEQLPVINAAVSFYDYTGHDFIIKDIDDLLKQIKEHVTPLLKEQIGLNIQKRNGIDRRLNHLEGIQDMLLKHI